MIVFFLFVWVFNRGLFYLIGFFVFSIKYLRKFIIKIKCKIRCFLSVTNYSGKKLYEIIELFQSSHFLFYSNGIQKKSPIYDTSKTWKYMLYLCLFLLQEIQSLLKSKQEEINKIRHVSDKIVANKSNIKNDIVNLKEILDAADDIKKRYRDIFVQISDRCFSCYI